MAGIAVAGNMIVDRYLEIETFPKMSTLTTIESVSQAPGGLLCNCAIDLARLDPAVRIPVVGLVGADEAGDYLVSALEQYPNIDTSGIQRAGETSFTEVLEETGTGSRTFLQYRGANALLDVDHFNFDALDADLLHVGYALLLDSLDRPDADYGTRLARLLAAAQQAGVATSIDAVSENSDRFQTIVPPALKYTDYLIVNEYEAARIAGRELANPDAVTREELLSIARQLLNAGVSRWVVIHWKDGAAAVTASGESVCLPSVDLQPDEIATRTGAGDAFASGTLWGAWAGRSVEEALRLGLGTAALSLGSANATDGVRPYREALDYYAAATKMDW